MQVAVLNSVETVRMVKAGFHVLGRASDDLELTAKRLGHVARQHAEPP